MDPIYLVANYSLFPFKRFCLYIFPEGEKGGRKEVERKITKNENRSKRRENDVNKGAGFRKEEMDESHRETLLPCPSLCSFSRSPGCCQTLPSPARPHLLTLSPCACGGFQLILPAPPQHSSWNQKSKKKSCPHH